MQPVLSDIYVSPRCLKTSLFFTIDVYLSSTRLHIKWNADEVITRRLAIVKETANQPIIIRDFVC
jgi:hypothetical protein